MEPVMGEFRLIAKDALFWFEPDQVAFLHHHKIEFEKVFDARGLRRAQYREVMGAMGLVIAVGVTPCPSGHGMRNRHGQCIVCNPESLAYSARHHRTAMVYVAHSKSGHVIKVGSSANLDDRFDQLNVHQYGGYDDWTLLDHCHFDNAGRVELAIHERLAKYNVTGEYGARPESCRELFRCKPSIARAAFAQVRRDVEGG